jgi:hypothetical protein
MLGHTHYLASARTNPTVIRRLAIVGAALLSFVFFLTTLQLDINGSSHPYATDVGEIQNALPRWGTIHFTGYPLYMVVGSAFVTVLRPLGIPPAAGSSLFSAVWGAVSVGLLTALALDFDVPPPAAVITAVLFGLSTSMWLDASIAEVHTMTMALTLATLLAALRFSRHGQRRDLLWMVFLFSQGVAHQRAVAFLGPAVLVLALRQWRTLWRGLPAAFGMAILGPLTYLYLPLRAWQGATWTFGSPGEWQGFWDLVLDTKADRIIAWPHTSTEWLSRAQGTLTVLADDWPLLLLALGLLGLLCAARRDRWIETLGLFLAWAPYLALCLIIWIGRVGDAVLAAKLPVVAMSALGLAFLMAALTRRSRLAGAGAVVLGLVVAGVLWVENRPAVLAITRDPAAEATIALAAQITPPPDGRPVTLMALWGGDYWALAYAQAFRGELADLHLVDHNADFEAVLSRGDHLLTLSRNFYQLSLKWWNRRLGRAHLSSFTPGIVEIAPQPPLTSEQVPVGHNLALGNNVTVRDARLSWQSADILLLTIYWQAEADQLENYSVAVHLLAQDPPSGPQDIVAQADRLHPVDGWYPIGQWSAGEIVRDHYLLEVPAGVTVQAARLGMYQVLDGGQFHNTAWLSLPVPPLVVR